ncbi:MAG: DNA integrity scanning protein DisA nucleotide-binding domain protein, partial [Clostridia bacterium]|nr:DNA integrity scanning protein DisA nucleotide-binding domain protein [Clostridia bacterium]
IGITEVIDVLSIVVSEETGVITLVRRGEIERYADATVMTKALEEIYGIRSLNL